MKKLKFVWAELWRMLSVSKGALAAVFLLNISAAAADLFYADSLNRLFSSIVDLEWNGIVLRAFLILGAVVLLQDILNAVSNYVMDWQQLKVQKGYMCSYFEKVDRLGAVQMQDPKILDTLESIRNGKEAGTEFMIHMEVLVSNHLFYFVFMMIYLCRIHYLLALAVMAAYLPSVFTYRMKNRATLKNEAELAGYRRQKDAFCSYVVNHKFLKETRFWGAEKMFGRRFAEADQGYQKEMMRGFRKQNGIGLFANFTYVLGFGVVLGAVLYLVRQQAVSVAEVATVLAVVISVYDKMDEVMNFHIAGMAQCLGGLLNMHKLMETVSEDGGEDLEGNGYEIALADVSFSYPDAEGYALRDVSLQIRKGELLAIVGENGSGKTTLSKVLCGLYPPTRGKVLINGKEGKEIRRRHLMGKVSAVFQDFNRYPLTVGENIGIGDLGTYLQGETDEGKLRELADFAGIRGKIDSEEAGFRTLLSREFGGVDWSGGLWQRLAIARAAYKECSFFVFDEPTAAIDPLEELAVMEKMAVYAKGKTAVLVTHRIGAAKLADRILVMAHGAVCEMGTHEELMKLGGEYARMYEVQGQWYHEG